MKSLGTILLAAGASTRLGRPKQLVEFAGEPVVLRQVKLLLGLEPACTVVVTGSSAAGVEQALAGLPVQLVHNASWEKGMGSSLASGIRAMPERVRGALLLLCDQWRVDAADLANLAEAWRKDPLAAAVSCWDEAIGPPVIFPRALFDRLSRLQGESGARQALKSYKGGLLRVPVPNAAFDLDRPEDLDSAQRM